ncbi:MAG: winged helix-turn-helix domain-containing protein [Gammaproteobacteria bacterium]|nr:winged helix-turn-helix domain-containing protein [Gammaproteobacteria bacterium]
MLDEIAGGGTTTKLEPRAMDVLMYLAGRPGEVVSVDDLRAHVWAGVIVTPDSVYRAINAIRRAFEDDPRAPRYIVNVPRRGYRLVASVAPETTTRSDATVVSTEPAGQGSVIAERRPLSRLRRPWAILAAGVLILGLATGGRLLRSNSTPSPAPAVLGDKSIAVLPFVDMSVGQDQGYFVDGLTEEVLDLLTRVQGLKVIARTSSFSFRNSAADVPTIARQLHVAHVLEGSVRKSGDHLRVTTQLIRADSGVHLWSETYEREISDVFALQDEIAAAVVAALRIQLLPAQAAAAPRTTSMVAYNEYLLGREFQNRGTAEDYRHAAEAYRRAIALDPSYAPSYAGLALADIVVADESGTTRVRLGAALDAADRAISLAPDQADGYSARGYLRYAYAWDWRGAQSDFRIALARAPGDSTHWRRYADLLASTGRLREAIAAGRNATALDPISAPAWGNLGMYLAAYANYAEAERALRRALDISADSPFALNGLATLKLLQGRPGEARELFQRITLGGFRLTGTAMAEHSLGHAGESQRALELLLAQGSEGWAYEIAEAYAWRGDSDNALEWLERARTQHDPGLTTILVDPLLRDLRTQHGYEAVVQRLNLQRLAAVGQPAHATLVRDELQ